MEATIWGAKNGKVDVELLQDRSIIREIEGRRRGLSRPDSDHLKERKRNTETKTGHTKQAPKRKLSTSAADESVLKATRRQKNGDHHEILETPRLPAKSEYDPLDRSTERRFPSKCEGSTRTFSIDVWSSASPGASWSIYRNDRKKCERLS